jgi:hypothetical protein
METYSIESFVENKHMMRDKRLGNSSRVSTTIKAKHWKEIARITDTLDKAKAIFNNFASHNSLRLVETYTGLVIATKSI